MKWFRLYSEARNDAKLRSLTDAQHRVWFNLLCYASEMEQRGCISAIDRELLAVECAGADTDLLNETIEKLTRLRIVTAEAENVCFVNFMKRQYDKPSAAPERVAERVSKHRATKPEASNTVVTRSNAVVTPEKRTYSDTDSETENTQKRTEEEQDAPNGAAALPPGDNAVKIFIDLFTDKIGEPPDIPPRFTKPLKETMSRVGRDRYRAAICAFLSDGWGSETGYSVQTFVSMPVDRWTRAEPKTPVRASPASKNGAAASADYYANRVDGILGGPRA